MLEQKLKFGPGKALLETDGAQWDYCGRADLVQNLQGPFDILVENKGKGDKQLHPLLIAFACPGQGKSRFLQELPGIIEECRQKKHHAKYTKTVAFLITCENGLAAGNWETQEFDADRFVACRMLWQLRKANQEAFNKAGAPQTFGEFRAKCSKLLVPEQVIKAVLEEPKETIVVIGVDGMQKLVGFEQRSNVDSKATPFYQVMGTVCRLVNAEEIDPLIVGSVTAIQSVDHSLAGSSQYRHYVKLPLVDSVKINGEDQVRNHPLKDVLVEDMGGHGRALEALVSVLKTNLLDGADVMGSVVTKLLKSYPDLLKFGSESGSETCDVKSITEVLIAALTGQLIPTNDKLGNIDPQQLELARLDYEEGHGAYRLQVPYVWLQIMLTKVVDQNNVLKPWGFMDYAQLAHSPSPDDWEKFNADFRVLKSRTIQNGAQNTVEELHRGAIISSDLTGLQVINEHLHKYKAKARIATASSICGNPKGTADSKAKKPASGLKEHECRVKDDEGQESVVSLEQTDVLVLNAPQAPAADAVLRLQTDNKLIAECLQMKQGDSDLDVQTERKKACDADDILVVLRNVQSEAPPGEKLIFVSEAQFKAYYGLYSGRAFNRSRFTP